MKHAAGRDAPGIPVPHTGVHHILRRYFEFAQDLIVAGLCVILLVVMVYSLVALGRMAFIEGGRPSQVLSQIVLLLVLVELFRTLIFYLREHRVSVSLMLGVAIVSELREIFCRIVSADLVETNGLAQELWSATLVGDGLHKLRDAFERANNTSG